MAKRAIEEKQRITDPTLIPKGASRDSNTPIELLNGMASKGETKAKPDDPIEVKLGAHWNNVNANLKKVTEQTKGPRNL